MNITQAILHIYPEASPLEDFMVLSENGEQRLVIETEEQVEHITIEEREETVEDIVTEAVEEPYEYENDEGEIVTAIRPVLTDKTITRTIMVPYEVKTYTTITRNHWHIDGPVPSDEELQAAWEESETERQAVAYREKRRVAYPPIGDQLDALFRAGVFPEAMAAQLQAVKDAYPKDES